VIVSRYLSEPEAHDPVSTPHAGSESFTSKVWRAVRRAVPLRLPSLGAARQPFQRLDFWTASHPLSFKLRLYQVTEPKISMWQGFTWETLRYWQDLMSSETRLPADVADRFLDWLDEPPRVIPEMERLAHAGPFAD
jgi:hypothetical protein